MTIRNRGKILGAGRDDRAKADEQDKQDLLNGARSCFVTPLNLESGIAKVDDLSKALMPSVLILFILSMHV